MGKFQNKYRIPSARKNEWDYASSGAYFITICTEGREYLFGEIENGEMKLSSIGDIIQQEWNKSFEIRRELFCDTFMIMPNHLHAIVRIDNDGVETHGRASLQKSGIAYRSPKSISSFVAGFKSAVTKRINEWYNTPGKSLWQSRFYDHIIRDSYEYINIQNYILENPLNWFQDDLFNVEKI